MKKLIILLSFFLIGINGFAQQTAQQVDLDSAYHEFVQESIAFYGSDEYATSQLVYEEYFDKIYLPSQEFICDTDDFEVWINENLSKTKCNSIKEAVQLFSQNKILSEKVKVKKEKLLAQEATFVQKYGESFMENYELIMIHLTLNKIKKLQTKQDGKYQVANID